MDSQATPADRREATCRAEPGAVAYPGERGNPAAASDPARPSARSATIQWVRRTSDRRRFLRIAGAALLARILVTPVQAWGSPRSPEAFGANSLGSILAALSLPAPIESRAIVIAAPDVAENGAQVPVEVTVGIDDVARVLLIGEGNRRPLLADFRRGERSLSWFETRVRLSENSRLLVVAEAGGRLYSAARPIRVIVGGCPG